MNALSQDCSDNVAVRGAAGEVSWNFAAQEPLTVASWKGSDLTSKTDGSTPDELESDRR